MTADREREPLNASHRAYKVYCLYASMKGDEPSPWLIAAEDEYAWESDPDRCEAVFKEARAMAERNDWDVREVTLLADVSLIYKAFEPAEISAEVDR